MSESESAVVFMFVCSRPSLGSRRDVTGGRKRGKPCDVKKTCGTKILFQLFNQLSVDSNYQIGQCEKQSAIRLISSYAEICCIRERRAKGVIEQQWRVYDQFVGLSIFIWISYKLHSEFM